MYVGMRVPERQSKSASEAHVPPEPLEQSQLNLLFEPVNEARAPLVLEAWSNTFGLRHSQGFRQNQTPREIFDNFPALKTSIGLEMVSIAKFYFHIFKNFHFRLSKTQKRFWKLASQWNVGRRSLPMYWKNALLKRKNNLKSCLTGLLIKMIQNQFAL